MAYSRWRNKLGNSIRQLREVLYREITSKSATNAKLRRALNKIAVEQGFKGFVEDIEFAIAGQMGNRLIGQILFYFALRRKQPGLNPIALAPGAPIPASLALIGMARANSTTRRCSNLTCSTTWLLSPVTDNFWSAR